MISEVIQNAIDKVERLFRSATNTQVLKYIFLCFQFFLSVANASAQTNESDTLRFKADLALTGFYQSGNVETRIFRAKSELSFKPIDHVIFKTRNSYVYQEFGKQKADEDMLSLNFLYYHPEKRVYPLVLGIASSNYRRQIDLRYLVGAGVTFQLLKKEEHWLKFAISSEYEQTSFANSDFNRNLYDGNQRISTVRGTLWANGRYQLFNKKLIVSHEIYAQPSLQANDNFRWQADLGLQFPLKRHLDFKVNYIHTVESIVIQGQKEQDAVLSFGFNLRSY
jgi:hypothetical protein